MNQIPSMNYSLANGSSSTAPLITFLSITNPTVNDINYPVGKRWINTETAREFILTGFSSANATVRAIWLALDGESEVESFITNIDGPVVPRIDGAVLMNASSTTYTDGSVNNTIKIEVQGDENGLIVGTGSNSPVTSIDPGTAGQFLISNGPLSAPSFQNIPEQFAVFSQKFTASGTYTPTSGMRYCVVECVGGGGGGGGCAATTAGEISVGGGGGSGSYSRVLLTDSQVGVSQVVTVGSGGASNSSGNTTSVGTLITAGGGGAAVGGSAGTGFVLTAGGNGGGAGTSTAGIFFSQPGNAGGYGIAIGSGNTGIAGLGAGSSLGGGALGGVASNTGVPGANAANNTGAGGGGACATNSAGGSALDGGTGGSGIVIILEYV